ncbi:uncharacterized protein si:ch211-91p5.3 [Hoplias malabaricus]|uniref:uncharacterized protein si:ch211-91p5.3 n=1 Tax=Hoplias malabaricus TaxID=27720 RepID=UPI003462DA72
MAEYTRFRDQKYKNWLKTAESLYILRNNLRDFMEKETETYHSSLKEHLKAVVCEKHCKKLPICDKCELWKKEILKSYIGSVAKINWKNCEPHLWPTEKWEVAKVFMPKGHDKHRHFDEFDVPAVLNFISHCRYFKNIIKGSVLDMVISLRNSVMHSPDFTLTEEKMVDGKTKILNLAKALEGKIPDMHKNISEAITQFISDLENYTAQNPQADTKSENIKLLDREQQALKEKIELLTQLYDTDQKTELKEELQGVKNFFDQNKDLLENLRPQVDQLNEIQKKVDKHELEIDNLSSRMEDLEKINDPMFSADTLKFKNHLIELALKRKWEVPEFTEESEACGYRGRVEVNGHTYKGSQVCKRKKDAHQEVAKLALDALKDDFEMREEPSTSESISAVTPSASSTNLPFYCTLTVSLNKEICSDGCQHENEAIESAYKKLALLFRLNDTNNNNTFRAAVLAHFGRCKIQPPSEESFQNEDKKFCKLKLSEQFTFDDKDGSTTKKKAEQQVAKIAIEKMSEVLNYTSDVVNENYKGFLKERLEALGMERPVYNTKESSEGARSSRMSKDDSHISSTQTEQHGQQSASPQDSATVVKTPHKTLSDCAVASLLTEIQDSNPSAPGDIDMEKYSEINSLLEVYNLKPPPVKVEDVNTHIKINQIININLENFTFKNSNACSSKKEATRKTYCLLGRALGICQPNTDEIKSTMFVKEDFSKKSLPLPKENVEGDKAFICSLTEITYSLIYNGQGSTEADAKQDALRKALSTLPLLFGHEALPISSSTEANEQTLNTLLRAAGQRDITFSLKPNQYNISINLRFKDYTMTSKSQKSKKENRNLLSKRILGLLGVETEANPPSFRNCLDEWFIQNALQQPVFEDTEVLGTKATFSVDITCTNPDWEDSLEAAKKKLVQELEKRFRYLID